MDVCNEQLIREPLIFETEIISTLSTGESDIAKVDVKVQIEVVCDVDDGQIVDYSQKNG